LGHRSNLFDARDRQWPSQSKSFLYPVSILNLGIVGFKQELSNNQVTARIGYKF